MAGGGWGAGGGGVGEAVRERGHGTSRNPLAGLPSTKSRLTTCTCSWFEFSVSRRPEAEKDAAAAIQDGGVSRPRLERACEWAAHRRRSPSSGGPS